LIVTSIAKQLEIVRARIAAAEARYDRAAGSVQLLAVSKTFPAEAIRAAYVAGQTRFGESYVQEALAKIGQLRDCAIEWHFIGPIQSNKTRDIARNFSWVHGVDRLKIAQRLSEQRAPDLPPLHVCIQVNISGEATKSGVDAAELPQLARAAATLPRVYLRGLMAIPAPEPEFARQRAAFARVRTLFEQLRADGLPLDTLSMGMSDDLEAAVAEGATLVRVGTAIFGARD
jgi:hypothetical protein